MRTDNVGLLLNMLPMIALSIFLGSTQVDAASSVEKTTTAATATTTSNNKWFRQEPNQPRKKDMKVGKLNKLIGSDYNEIWMSKTPIKTAGNGTGDKSETTEQDSLQLPEQLPAQYQDMVRAWLVRRGSCSVDYAWTDLGKSFWPRWIKKGRCGRSETSCSWPPGMSCMPSSVKVLNLLRWHCWLKNRKNKRKNRQKRQSVVPSTNKTNNKTNKTTAGVGNVKGEKKKNDGESNFRCLWIKVPYPVTEFCTCACKRPEE